MGLMNFNFWVQHFANASILAKFIYLALIALSVTSWAIILRKIYLFRRISAQSVQFLELYRRSRRDTFSLYHQFVQNRRNAATPLYALFMRGCEEIESLTKEGVGKRPPEAGELVLSILQIENLQEIMFAEMDRRSNSLESGQTFLATTSSISPLLGLLGTVWGVLEAFLSMGSQGGTSVTTLAPGMAEALVATVGGLLVAIPANLGYNFLGQKARDISLDGDSFITEFITSIKRFWGVR